MGPAAQSLYIVRRFCDEVSDGNDFNLDLLRAVDMTVELLHGLCESCDGQARIAQVLAGRVAACELTEALDPDNIILQKIKSGGPALLKIVARLGAGRQAALDDGDLVGDHKDAVVEAYDQAIASAESLRDGMNELRKAVEEHDAKLLETIGPFNTVEELLQALDS